MLILGQDMGNPKLEFIGWDRSAVELAGERLLAMAFAEREEDREAFRRATVVVPSAESGRRLREWLAVEAKRRYGKPLLMPRTTLAGQLIRPHGEQVATELETTAAWMEVLTDMLEQQTEDDWGDSLFSRPRQEDSWTLGTARQLMQLRRQLVQYEVSLPLIIRTIREHGGMLCEPEAARAALSDKELASWQHVASDEELRWLRVKDLFVRVDATLTRWGRVPAHRAEEAELQNPTLRYPGAPIILACLPEISPQVQRYLKRIESLYPGSVRIWINAPDAPEWREHFDADRCGRLESTYWATREVSAQELPETQLNVAASAQRMALKAIELAAGLPQEEVALASCDASFTPALVTEFRKAGWQINVPEGRSFMSTDAAMVPELMAEACLGGSQMKVWEPLLRNRAMQRCYAGPEFDEYTFGLLLDKLMRRYFPAQPEYLERLLDPARPLPELSRSQGALPGSPQVGGKARSVEYEVAGIAHLRKPWAFRYVQQVREAVRRCQVNLSAGLAALAAQLRLAYRGGLLQTAVETMAAQVDEVSLFIRQHAMPDSQAWALLKHIIRDHTTALVETPRDATQIDALGWRELPYAQGSQLILTGFHEGCVPELVAVDSFLPDSLRKRLGMPCKEWREARDAFLLTALLHRKGCRVNVLLSRLAADGSGTILSPSSLLFHCRGEELVKRVAHLFSELRAEDELDVYQPWKLCSHGAEPPMHEMESVSCISRKPNPYANPEHAFSPSEIKSFLACPLRFWMKKLLGISPWDAYKEDKVEMEANEYGTLLHSVLEDVSRRYPKAEPGVGVDDVWEYARAQLHARSAERYGSRLLAPQKLQAARMSAALRQFVNWHCVQLAEGWECYDCEHEVSGHPFPLPDGSVAHVTMRADRIDYKPESNEWRIIDFKTHERSPRAEHLEYLSAQALQVYPALMPAFPLVEYVDAKGRAHQCRWRDVQLPMYAHWLMQEKHCSQPEMAYLNLPRNSRPLAYSPMVEMDTIPHALESALESAGQAIMLMRAGLCLYSAESLGCTAFGSFSATAGQDDPRELFSNLRTLYFD